MSTEPPVSSILTHPYWRVNVRPERYDADLIPSLAECYRLIEQTKVSLRGWDYPHLSHRDTQRGVGDNWVASWSDFDGHKEYWRLYQSGQFLHLFSVREATDSAWREKLEHQAKAHDIDHEGEIDWSKVPGFFSILNFIYTVTEVFEFSSRLCQKGLYTGAPIISIQLNGIKGFVLMTDLDRAWHGYYAASQDLLEHSWQVRSDVLIADSAAQALNAIDWFFQRFNWLNPSKQILREDQRKFLTREV